jgi:hypothetical protein
MTRESGFIEFLEDYLDGDQGYTPLPDHVRDAIRAELPSTHQRPAWWPGWRFPEMNSFAKLGVAAAIVAVAALVGYNYLVAPNIGNPNTEASPSPVSTPRALYEGALEAGVYATGHGLDATIAIQAGWTSIEQRGVAKDTASGGMVVSFWPFPGDFNVVYTDPCNWSTTVIEPPVGPTVDDLANALAAQQMRGDATPVDVTIDGYSGKYLDMTVPSDIDFSTCDQAEFRSWEGRSHQGPGQVDRVYILDVDG